MRPLILTPKISFVSYRILFFIFLIFSTFSCSVDDEVSLQEADAINGSGGKSGIYKGVFASRNITYRGVFDLTIPQESKYSGKSSVITTGKITLQTGEVFEARGEMIPSKNSDVQIKFESNDLSFIFSYDENGNPVITNVVFKEEQASILVAEHTEDSPVTPVTGTFKCTNCQDQDSTLNGIDLHNAERTFNMLLTTKDGTTSIGIQALVGILVDTNIAVQENCSTTDKYTICTIKSGDYQMKEPVSWSGVQRHTTDPLNGEECFTISGKFEYASPLGSIQGEFKSDSTCPNTTYFVSPSGNDANTGLSPQDAWRSISKINNMDLQPGDIVLFEGNQEFNGKIYLDSKDAGNAANPIKISSYGTGKAIIKAGNDAGIYVYNTSGVLIDNIIVAGSGATVNKSSGIFFYNDLAGDQKLDFIEITNCEVFGFREYGILIGAWNGNSGFSNVLIENNKVHDILDSGISSYGKFSSTKTGYAHSNITVRNCEVYNIKGFNKSSGHSGNGIVISDVQNSIIEHCTVYNSGSGNTHCGGPVGIWYWDSDQVTIQFSEVYNMSSGKGCDGGGFDLDGGVTNGLMQYNYSHNNDGAGFLVGQFTGARPMHNITVRYNISQNDAATNGGSVYLFNGQNNLMKDIYVYNNTFYLSEQSTNQSAATVKYSLWRPVKDNINFYNNILYAENGADLIDIPSGYAGNFSGNLYYTSGSFQIKYQGNNYSSLEAFRNTGNEISENIPAGVQDNPQLTNPGNGGIVGFGNSLSGLEAYKLITGSPAVNAGSKIPGNIGTRDFFGKNLSQTDLPQIGAHHKPE